MKRITLLSTLLLAIGLTMTGCNQKEPADSVKAGNGLPKAGQNVSPTAALGGVAVVDIDTLAAKYEFCVEGQKRLEAKQRGYSSQLENKGAALQRAAADFQKKLQQGAFTTQQQAEAAQAKVMQQDQALKNYEATVQREMSKAAQDYQEDLRKRLNDFLKVYNKDGRYKVILSRSGDNILYTDPAVDITNDVIAGLNKGYKKDVK